MFCNKCQTDVNPVKVMGNSSSGKRDQGDGGVPTGFHNICPLCSMPLPDDEQVVTPVPGDDDDAANEPLIRRPVSVAPRPIAKAQPRKSGNLVDDLRASLVEEDAKVAAWSAEIEGLKREIKLAKQRSKGLANMLAAYERANPQRPEVH